MSRRTKIEHTQQVGEQVFSREYLISNDWEIITHLIQRQVKNLID